MAEQGGSLTRNVGGTHSPGFMQFSHPATLWETSSGTVGFHWSGQVDFWSTSISVTKCDGYFVYDLVPAPQCTLGYATEN